MQMRRLFWERSEAMGWVRDSSPAGTRWVDERLRAAVMKEARAGSEGRAHSATTPSQQRRTVMSSEG